jgi:hypothetical protein
MTQLQIVENPLGSVGHTDSVDVGGVTGLGVVDVGGCGRCYILCYTEQGMLFSSDNLCVLTRHGDFLVWKSTRVHQCTQLQVIRPDGRCTCKCLSKVKRITFTCYLRKHLNLNTQYNATSASPSHTKSERS